MQPYIAISPCVGNDFRIEARYDNEGDWEQYFNGSCLTLATQCLNLALRDNPTYNVRMVGWGSQTPALNGYIFRVKTEIKDHKFFRQNVHNPFENRKVYQASEPGSSVSFTMLGT